MAQQKKTENPIAKRFKSVGSEFLFNLAVEQFWPIIIKNFKEWLAPITPEKMKEMVRKGEMPELDPTWFDAISGYRKYLLKITRERMAEILAEARKDLFTAIMECGEEGFLWLCKLHLYLLECIDHPEKLIPEPPPPTEKMVMARCDVCNKSWPVKKTEFANIDKCPFCAAPQGTPAPPPPPVENQETEQETESE
jgi:hypothetical protein